MPEADVHEVLVLREMDMRDAPSCAALSRAVGWPHRIEDWEMVIGLGRGVVVTLGEAVVATAMWWSYGERHATLGMIIVSPEHQGASIGKRLMAALFAQAEGRSLMLNATSAGESLYARFGFVPCDGVCQYHGEALAVVAAELPNGARLRPGTIADLAVLGALDRQASGLPRGAVLSCLLELGECVVLERCGEPVGFSILRRFGRGFVVGPVVAPNAADARALISVWLDRFRGQFIRVDVEIESGLGDWLRKRGLKPAGTVTAMVRGERPSAPGPARLYALVNQALG